MTGDHEHGPYEAYQYSAMKVAYASTIFRFLAIALVVVLMFAAIATMAYNTVSTDQKIDCETAAFNSIIGQLQASHVATVEHKPPPQFTYPKPC